MVQKLPNSIVKITSAIILTLIPLLISGIVLSPILENSDIELTVFEKFSQNNRTSNLEILIQNVGSQPSTDLILFVDSDAQYTITDLKTTDTVPHIIDEEKLRVEIQRLSPQAYVEINASGKATSKEKDVWVTSNQETELITIPVIGSDLGISSVDISEKENQVYLGVLIFGFIALFGFRYYNFYRSEYARRAYLGVHDIPLVRYKSSNLVWAFILFSFATGIGFGLDGYFQPYFIEEYVMYEYFNLNENVKLQNFLQIDTGNYDFVTGGMVIMIIALLPMHIIANRDINLPDFIWSLPRSHKDVLLKDVELSFISSEPIAIVTTKKLSDIDVEIFEITEKNEIIGLISKKIIGDYKEGDKYNFKSIFNETKRSTKKIL